MIAVLALITAFQSGGPAYFANPRLTESSGVVVSRAYPGVLWTHNDSGDQPYLYATDVNGADRGRIRVTGAHAVDWEDLALGPCPTGTDPVLTGTCLYIADTGDKREKRSSVTIYAVPEPRPPQSPRDTLHVTGPAAALRLQYPQGPDDVEALYVLPRDTAVYLITKGRNGKVGAYRVDQRNWSKGGARPNEVQRLDIKPNAKTGRLVTSAAIRPDGRVVAIRTYSEIYVYAADSAGRLTRLSAQPCALAELPPGSEAIDFVDDSTLVVTSEAKGRQLGTISLLRLRKTGDCVVSAAPR